MIVINYIDILNLKKFIKNNDILFYDIETDSLNWKTGNIIGFGISNFEIGYYFPLFKYDKENGLIKVNTKSAAIEILNLLKNKKIVCHNAAFDLRFTKYNLNIDLLEHLYVDTMLLKHTIDEELPFGLKEISSKLFGNDVKIEQQEMKESIKLNGGTVKEYYKADLNLLAKYCIKDCLLTSKLYNYYMPKLKNQGLEDFYFKDEVMPLYKTVTIPMEEFGIKLDIDLLKKSLTDINIDLQELETKIQEQIKPYLNFFTNWFLNKEYPASRAGVFAQGIAEYFNMPLPKTKTGNYSLTLKNINNLIDSRPKNILLKQEYLNFEEIRDIQLLLWNKYKTTNYMFNLLSKHHLKKLFFDTLKETPVSKTEKGSPQVDDEFLKLMSNKYEWCKLLHIYNKLIKIKGTYIERFLQESIDGKFYASFMQHRTISGRYGSNLQQLPRPIKNQEEDIRVVKYTNLIRQFFISEDNYIFIDSDYKTLEPRVFAHVSNDNNLKNIFINNYDFYSYIAIKTEKLKNVSAHESDFNYLGKINKEKRQKAKSYSLGIPYGMSGYKLQFELNVPQSEAEQLVKDYLDSFPDLHRWMQQTETFVKKNGYIKSEAGRIRHLYTAKKIYDSYGDRILNSLQLWQDYSNNEQKYKEMKELRLFYKNILNNANNFQIQSLSASIVNRAAIAINKWLKDNNIKGQVIAQIHDQLIINVPKQYAQLTLKNIQYIMENNYKLSVPLLAPGNICTNFYEGH